MDAISPRARVAPAPQDAAAVRPAPELGIVVANIRDRDDVPRLVERLARALAGHDWEVVFVGDAMSAGPAAAASAVGATDSRVRAIRRVGRRGLAGACLDGMLASQARHLAVMEADDDETLLVAMFDRLQQGDVDAVIASRSPRPDACTYGRNWAAALIAKVLAADLADPASRFVMIRRDAFEALVPALSSQSVNILLDFLLAARGRLRIAELPCAARDRSRAGALDPAMALEIAGLGVARLTNDAISIRFLMFCLVGLSGVGIHMAILRLGLATAGFTFAMAQTAAAVGAMVWNFTLNNVFTYHDQRLVGRAFLNGLIRFQFVCAIGAISNVGVASFIYNSDRDWWVAGLGGVLMGAVWNYAVTSVFVWHKG